DDIFAARCGLIHAAQVESELSRSLRARVVLPVLKPAPIAPFQSSIDDAGIAAVAVYLDELLSAFTSGMHQFRADVEADIHKKQIVEMRAGKVPVIWNASKFKPRS